MRAVSSTYGRGVDVGAAQLGCEQVPAAEDVEWKITIAIVVAVEEAALLVAVQGIVGGVEVEDDVLGRRGMRLQEQRHEQALDLARVMADLVVAARREGGPFLGRMLQPVEVLLPPPARSYAAEPSACRPAPPWRDRGAADRGR